MMMRTPPHTMRLLLIGALMLACWFRFTGVNWDQGHHLHPDERFLTMVTETIQWPASFSDYLDTPASPLNPHNKGFGFYVYGTFPVLLTKWVAQLAAMHDYNGITIVGRQLSALADISTVMLVFLIARWIPPLHRLHSSQTHSHPATDGANAGMIPLLALFLYAIMVLPIQLSHFYAVDTYLTAAITLTFFLCLSFVFNRMPTRWLLAPLSGVTFGLAIASKISAVLFAPIVAVTILYAAYRQSKPQTVREAVWPIIRTGVIFVLLFTPFVYGTVRLAQPYLFAGGDVFSIELNPKVLQNWKELKSFDGPQTGFPPALQWIPTRPYQYPLIHTIFWGIGLPLGILCLGALGIYGGMAMLSLAHRRPAKPILLHSPVLALSALWIVVLFGYQAGQFPKALRYLYPMYPFLAMMAAWLLDAGLRLPAQLLSRRPMAWASSMALVFFCLLLYPLGFRTIYTRAHSRAQASEWIYDHIPFQSTIANEHWDDGLPLHSNGKDGSLYQRVELPMYHLDTQEKWNTVGNTLETTDYIFLTSNRLWRSLAALPQKYPATSKYYEALFDGSLGFERLATFSSYSCLLPRLQPRDDPTETTDLHPASLSVAETAYCAIALNDDGAEESFTVYDHPKVIIFKKTPAYSRRLLYERLQIPSLPAI